MNVGKKIYLTFDMDWACDEVMEFLYDMLELYDISATINITNNFRILERYKKNKKIDLGIHPNFNFLMNGSEGGGVIKKTLFGSAKVLFPMLW